MEASGRDRKWGIGLGRNNPKAWKRATWRGQNKLGFMYVKGQGVKQSDVKAKELFKKTCDGGSEWGCKAYAILNKR